MNDAARKRILVIDDDPDVLNIVSALLSSTYHVRTAQGGAAGLRLLGHERYDLVLLDLCMPGVDGETVKRTLDSAGDRTPVVLLSGERDLTAHARRLGAQGQIAKPFDLEVIEAVVRRMLNAASRLESVPA